MDPKEDRLAKIKDLPQGVCDLVTGWRRARRYAYAWLGLRCRPGRRPPTQAVINESTVPHQLVVLGLGSQALAVADIRIQDELYIAELLDKRTNTFQSVVETCEHGYLVKVKTIL